MFSGWMSASDLTTCLHEADAFWRYEKMLDPELGEETPSAGQVRYLCRLTGSDELDLEPSVTSDPVPTTAQPLTGSDELVLEPTSTSYPVPATAFPVSHEASRRCTFGISALVVQVE